MRVCVCVMLLAVLMGWVVKRNAELHLSYAHFSDPVTHTCIVGPLPIELEFRGM